MSLQNLANFAMSIFVAIAGTLPAKPLAWAPHQVKTAARPGRFTANHGPATRRLYRPARRSPRFPLPAAAPAAIMTTP